MSVTASRSKAEPRRIDSRAKGAGAEREFSRLILEHLGVPVVRNLDQARQGGHDLQAPGTDPVSLALDRYAFEVKRRAAIKPADLAAFWAQTEAQATRAGKVPALAVRADREPWRVLIPLTVLNAEAFGTWPGLNWAAEISVSAFCCLVRESVGGC